MGRDSVTREELLAEIAALVSDPVIPEGWFRAADVMEESGQSRDIVCGRLKKQVKMGVLGTQRIGGSRYYYKLEGSNG